MKFKNLLFQKEAFVFYTRSKNLVKCHLRLNPLLCAINWDRFPFKINMYFKTLMPGHALEIFNETDKIEIYHHINQFEINPFYYEGVQFLI